MEQPSDGHFAERSLLSDVSITLEIVSNLAFLSSEYADDSKRVRELMADIQEHISAFSSRLRTRSA